MDDASRSAPTRVPRVNSAGPDPLIGRMINDRYKVVGLIARGGMGKVYRAEQAPLGRLVGLKVLNPNYTGDSDPEFHKRFFLEASIASKLTHPNTVTIFDYGRTDDDIYYIAMELLEGRTLHRALREEGPLDMERAMHVARQVCRSLREAHALGVIHRDLKPANVYLVQHGDESDFVKVLDFGLVKNLDEKGEELTQAGLFMGSPKYMSPEQIRGDRVDTRVDIYALGVIMYEMLTGKVPFDRPNSVNILMAHIQESVPPMAEMNPDVHVPPQLEQIVMRCMAKDVDERYASMDEVLLALKQCAGFSLMSGEHTLTGDFMLARTSSGPVRLQGDFLSGGTPSGIAALPPTMASQQPAPPTAMPPRSKLPYALVGAAVVAAVGIAFLGRGKQADSNVPEAPVVVAPGQPAPMPIQPAPGAQVPAVAPAEVAPPVVAQPPAEPELQAVLISLRSTPPGATVVVGEREYGPTPTQIEWTGDDAAPGREVTFRFQRKGYRDLTVTRTLRGDRLEVEAPPLDPIPVRRVAPARRAKPKPKPETATQPAPPAEVVPIRGGYKAEPY